MFTFFKYGIILKFQVAWKMKVEGSCIYEQEPGF
jgi:hypothetical protein